MYNRTRSMTEESEGKSNCLEDDLVSVLFDGLSVDTDDGGGLVAVGLGDVGHRAVGRQVAVVGEGQGGGHGQDGDEQDEL